MTTQLYKKFDNILLNKINGNISIYQNEIRKMKKTTLIQFLIFIGDNPTGENPTLKDILNIIINN